MADASEAVPDRDPEQLAKLPGDQQRLVEAAMPRVRWMGRNGHERGRVEELGAVNMAEYDHEVANWFSAEQIRNFNGTNLRNNTF